MDPAQGAQTDPVLARSGDTYLAAWSDYNPNGSSIYAARVQASTGTLIDNVGIGVATAPGLHDHPTVTAGASEFFVAWHDGPGEMTSWVDAYPWLGRGRYVGPRGLERDQRPGSSARRV